MRSRVILLCSTLLLSGCATTAPYLTPTAMQNQNVTYYSNGVPQAIQKHEKAEVKAAAYFEGGYLWLEIQVRNLIQETLQVHASDAVLLDGAGIMHTPADLRTAAYRTAGTLPPEQKGSGTKAMEWSMAILTGGLTTLVDSSTEDGARRNYEVMAQNAFRDFTIPPDATARGILVYDTTTLTYPVKVIVNVQGEKSEFQFNQA